MSIYNCCICAFALQATALLIVVTAQEKYRVVAHSWQTCIENLAKEFNLLWQMWGPQI